MVRIKSRHSSLTTKPCCHSEITWYSMFLPALSDSSIITLHTRHKSRCECGTTNK